MTYALRVKNELARLEMKKTCCQAAELAAFIRFGGNVQISGKRLALNVVTSNAAVARRVFILFKKLFAYNTELVVRKKIKLRKNNVYLIRITDSEKVKEVLSRLKLVKDGVVVQEISDEVMAGRCCRRAYLRGAFLAAGSITNPETSYHLEIYTDYQEQAYQLMELIETFDLKPKVTTRKNRFLVYLKDSDQIVEFLNVIGAHNALLNFENVRIIKGIRNSINRLVNFETANVNKTVEAALRQVECIRFIDHHLSLDSLPENLRELAVLRLANPEASLQELGEMLNPPVSKSGVNHRMRKLEKMAMQLKKGLEKADPGGERAGGQGRKLL